MTCDNRDELLARLSTLRAALDRLLAGESVTSFSTDDRSAGYQKVDESSLRAEIRSIELQLGIGTPRRPFSVSFS